MSTRLSALHCYSHFALLAVLASAPALVHAQQVPGGALPGQIERQFEQPPATPEAPQRVEPPRPDLPVVPADAQTIRFVLRSVVIDGATMYPAESIRATFAPLLGKEVSLAQVYQLTNDLTVRYRNDGYILSQARLVRDNLTAGGDVRIQVFEGYVSRVIMEGQTLGPRSHVQALADKITSTRPLTANQLERYLLLINDLGGVNARGVLRRAQEPGAAELVLQVEQRRLNGGIEVNNRGSKALGPARLEADVSAYSLPGRFSTLHGFASTTFNNELRLMLLHYEMPLGTEGLSVAVFGSVAEGKPDPDTTLNQLYKTRSETLNLRFSYPVIRTRAQNLSVRATLAALNGRTEVNDLLQSDDRLRSLRFGASYDRTDRFLGVNLVDVELSRGLDALGARESGSVNLSIASGRSDYTKLAMNLARLQGISSSWSVLFALQGQYAFNDLLIPETFSFGGGAFGRGYDPSELLGDSGAAFKAELRYAGSAIGPLRAYTAYGFYDIGNVSRRNAVNQPSSVSAASSGVGIRFNVLNNFAGFLELAKPLTRDVALRGDRNARLYAGMRGSF